MKTEITDTKRVFPIRMFHPPETCRCCAPLGKQVWRASPGLPIPEAIEEEAVPGIIRSGIDIKGSGGCVGPGFSVDLGISSACCFGLEVLLTSPSGTGIVLIFWGTRVEKDIRGNLPRDIAPRYALSGLWDEPLDGLWVLTVSSWCRGGKGSLDTWALRQD